MTERQVVPAPPGANRFGTVFMKRSAASGTRSWSAAARSASMPPGGDGLVDRAVQRVDDGLLDVIGIGTLRLGEGRDRLPAAHGVAQLGDLHIDAWRPQPARRCGAPPGVRGAGAGPRCAFGAVSEPAAGSSAPAVPMAPTLSSPAA